MTRQRLQLGALVTLVIAIALFASAVAALRWIAVVLVLATIVVLLWTLTHPDRRDA